jgi:hypothetical protein
MKTRAILAACLTGALLAVSMTAAAEGPTSPGFANANPQTKAQKAMLAVVQRWHDTYNTDPDKMILETYAKDADVMFTGASVHGHDQFLKLERGIKEKAPGRYMRVDQIYFIGDERTVVEAVILDSARPDFYSPWCAILKFKDNKIVLDRTYLDPANWPGIEAAKGVVTPGGLGAPSR